MIDLTNVSHFPLLPLNNIPESLRAWAGRIERGEQSCVRCIIVMETESAKVNYSCLGEKPFTVPFALGLLDYAKHRILE